MNRSLIRAVSRFLIVCLSAWSVQARAELIGTHQTVAPERAQPARAALAGKLQAYGVAPDVAQARVATLTDAEAVALVDRIADAPAGAFSGQTIGVIFVVLFLIWRFTLSDQAKAGEGKK